MPCGGIAPALWLTALASTVAAAAADVETLVRAAIAAASAAACGGVGTAGMGRCTSGAAVAGLDAEAVLAAGGWQASIMDEFGPVSMGPADEGMRVIKNSVVPITNLRSRNPHLSGHILL